MNRDFLYYLIPLVLRLLSGLGFTIPITTAYLSVQEFGQIAVILFYTGFIDILGSVSFGWAIGGRYLKITNDRRRCRFLIDSFFSSILYRFVILLFCYFIVCLLSFYFSSIDLHIVLIVILSLFFNSFWVFLKMIFIYENGHKKVFLGEIFIILITISFIYGSFHIMEDKFVAYFVAYLFIALFSFLLSVLFFIKYLSSYQFHALSFKYSMKGIVTVGLHPLKKNILEYIVKQGDRLIISHFSSLLNLGIYYHSRQYEQYFIQVSNSLNNSYTSKYLSFFEGKSDCKDIKKYLRIWSFLYFFAGIILVLISKDLINLLTHGKFGGAAFFVQVWYLTSMLSFISTPNLQGIFAQGATKEFSVLNEKIYIGYFPFMALLTYFFGVYGALFSACVLSFLIFATRFFVAKKYCGFALLDRVTFFWIALYFMFCMSYNFLWIM